MNKLKNLTIEEIVLFLFIFLPLVGGSLTKSDLSIIPLFFAVIIFIKKNFIIKDSIKLILLFGISQIILNSLILNNFFSISMIKGILILISPSLIYYSCKYVLFKNKNNIFIFKTLINFTLIFNFFLNLFPILNNYLSNILFLNRLKIGIINTSSRGDLNIFGEPALRALFIAGIAMIIINLKDIIYKNKIKYYFDLILSLFLIFSTKSATSVPVIFIIFIYLISSILEENKKILTFNLLFYFLTTTSTLAILFNRAFNAENQRLGNFLSYFFTQSNLTLADLISLDASIMMRIINYDLFLRNFPLNIDYFFGIIKENYAEISFQHASNNLFGTLNYDSLIDLNVGDGNYFRGQTTGLPTYFFNYGTIPTILLIVTIVIICVELIKSNKKFSTLPVISYLVFSLFVGPSLLFSIPYLIILTLIYKTNKIYYSLSVK